MCKIFYIVNQLRTLDHQKHLTFIKILEGQFPYANLIVFTIVMDSFHARFLDKRWKSYDMLILRYVLYLGCGFWIDFSESYTPHPYTYTFTPTFDTNYLIYPLYKTTKLTFHFSTPHTLLAVQRVQTFF